MTVTQRKYQDTKERGEWNEEVNLPEPPIYPELHWHYLI